MRTLRAAVLICAIFGFEVNEHEKEVLIFNIFDKPWCIEEEGAPYANLMIVALLRDKAKREQINAKLSDGMP